MNYSSLLSPIAVAALLGCHGEKPGGESDWLAPDTVQVAQEIIATDHGD